MRRAPPIICFAIFALILFTISAAAKPPPYKTLKPFAVKAKGSPPRVARFASYNIKTGVNQCAGDNLARTAAAIRELRASVIALQEVDMKNHRHNLDQTRSLAQKAGFGYGVFGPSIRNYKSGSYGVAVLSKHKLGTVRQYRLVTPPQLSQACKTCGSNTACKKTKRCSQFTDSGILAVQVKGMPGFSKSLWFVNVHNGVEEAYASSFASQMATLGKVALKNNFVIVGDFNKRYNFLRQFPYFKSLKSFWSNCGVHGVDGTFPARFSCPIKCTVKQKSLCKNLNKVGYKYSGDNHRSPIDHVFFAAKMKCNGGVGKSALAQITSDHLPIYVDLRK